MPSKSTITSESFAGIMNVVHYIAKQKSWDQTHRQVVNTPAYAWEILILNLGLETDCYE